MDIRLQPSPCLRALRISIFGIAAVAVLVSAPEPVLKLLVLAVVFLPPVLDTCFKDPAQVLSIQIGNETEEQTRDQKVIIELSDKRRIELSLKKFYCLWWVQILYLSSTVHSVIVVVLPDSCSAQKRRQLRQILNQRR